MRDLPSRLVIRNDRVFRHDQPSLFPLYDLHTRLDLPDDRVLGHNQPGLLGLRDLLGSGYVQVRRLRGLDQHGLPVVPGGLHERERRDFPRGLLVVRIGLLWDRVCERGWHRAQRLRLHVRGPVYSSEQQQQWLRLRGRLLWISGKLHALRRRKD